MARLLPFLLLFAAIQTAWPQAQFTERSIAAGLSFTYEEMLLMGGGAAAFDFDNDGDEDLYVVGGGRHDVLFENDGTGNFTDGSEEYGISVLTKNSFTTSVTTGDIDNDGRREIFIGTVGPVGSNAGFDRNLLLKYDPISKRYENVATPYGLYDASFCMGGHFFDVNQDGLLDLYVMNYVEKPGLITVDGQLIAFDHECGRNRLYINTGKAFFTESASEYSLINDGCTLAATTSDMDWDGDADLLIANDFGKWLEPNELHKNNFPQASFTDVSASSKMNAQMYAMGIAVGDYDEDGDLDYYFTNIARNQFFENNGNGTFSNKAPELGLEDTYATDPAKFTTGWGTFFEDVNNDSYLDLFVANGYVNSAIDQDGLRQTDRLFLGNAGHTFNDRTVEYGLFFEGLSRGAITADFNRDGKPDILTVTNDILFPGPINFLQFYENTSTDGNNWIAFKLEGQKSNRDAFGAKVMLFSGARKWLREVSGGSSHASQNSSVVHFGLGSLTKVDSVQVFWPGAKEETFYQPAAGEFHSIKQTEVREGITTGPGVTDNGFEINYDPATEEITIRYAGLQFQQVELLVSDVMGRVMIREKFLMTNGQEKVIGLDSPGSLFIVGLKHKDGVLAKKFVGF
jgi:hypothetical protein